jgi:hypothetical protein
MKSRSNHGRFDYHIYASSCYICLQNLLARGAVDCDDFGWEQSGSWMTILKYLKDKQGLKGF